MQGFKKTKQKKPPLAPRKVLNMATARARQAGADASWEMKSIWPPAACLWDTDRRGETEGGVCPESRRERGNIFCCCCILLINHFSFKTDAEALLQPEDCSSQDFKCITHRFPCNNISKQCAKLASLVCDGGKSAALPAISGHTCNLTAAVAAQ